ncbi:HlyD family secretion protein [Pseudomonas sp. dw_358]|uniref:HlyD family secretion protein n=1 Tax=Pseudomonas sp. dw_358 TaxID=2720083 RepID=UPI001BD45149|nr:HlyD family secretion protein [Pseudomonas sp. dw_358]
MNIAVDEPSRVEELLALKNKARQRWGMLAAASAAVIGLLAYGSYWYVTGRFMESTDDAYVRADWVGVSARIPGYVAQVLVSDDEAVKAGQVLIRLQDRDYLARRDQSRAERDKAEAAVATHRARLIVATSQVERQRISIIGARAGLAAAQAERSRSNLDLQRYQGLADDHAATTQRLETAQASSLQAGAKVQAARASLAEQQSLLQISNAQVQVTTAQLAGASAELRAAEARLTLADQDQGDTLVRAPIDGVIGQRRVRAGQYLVPGQPLMAVVPLRQIYVVANFKETQLGRMRPGQPVEVALDSDSSQRLQGTVASFSPGSGSVFALLPSDNATGNFTKIVQRFPVRILLNLRDSNVRILPGMSVVATVDTRVCEDHHER